MMFVVGGDKFAFKAHNNKFVCRQGSEGTLKANFIHKHQTWLKIHQEIVEIEWHQDDTGPRQHVSGLFAVKADNARYWRVNSVTGELCAIGQPEALRGDNELFQAEAFGEHFAIKSKSTGCYIEVKEDGTLHSGELSACNGSNGEQIKDSHLFQLALKVKKNKLCRPSSPLRTKPMHV